jgi:hypothetical protein
MRRSTQLLALAGFGICISVLSFVAAQSAAERKAQMPEKSVGVQTAPPLVQNDMQVGREIHAQFAAQHKVATQPTDAKSQPDTKSQPQLSDFMGLIDKAKASFKPVSAKDVRVQQQSLDAAVQRLDATLKNWGELGKEWREALRFDELKAELSKAKPGKSNDNLMNPDPQVLKSIAGEFTSGMRGLELKPFQAVAKTLPRFADLLAAYQEEQRDHAKSQSAYDDDLSKLSEALKAAAKNPANTDRQTIGELLGRIEASGQAPDLVAAVRRQFSQPNLFVRASKYFIARANDDETAQNHVPLHDCILGTDVEGFRDTTAHWTTTLVPNDKQAEMQITLNGLAKSQTTGYHGIVTVFSHGNTSLHGKKYIFLDAASGNTSDPACANCCTDTCIDCINVCAGRLITRIATKRVYGSKSEAEAVASDHAAGQVDNQMDRKADQSLSTANHRFDVKFRNPLLARGAFPQELAYSTTNNWLKVDGLQARADELGASTKPPDASPEAQLSARVHESFIENMTAAVLPGRSIRGLAYRRWMRDQTGERYEADEFHDFLLCMAEVAADKPDKSLVVPFDQFQTLMKNHQNLDVTEKQYKSLATALYNGTLTQQDYNRYLADLPRETVSYDDVMTFLAAAKRGAEQVDYSAMTFDTQRPVSIQFRDGNIYLKLRIAKVTAKNLDPDGNRITRECPAEIFVAYRVKLSSGALDASRIEGQYGINSLPLPPDVEATISAARKAALYNRRRKELPLRFFGDGSKPKIDGDVVTQSTSANQAEGQEGAKSDNSTAANSEPIFPEGLPQSKGLQFRGDVARRMNDSPCPWVQFSAQDGWLAMAWALPEWHAPAESTSLSDSDVQ